MGTRSEDAGSRQQGRGGQEVRSVRRGVQVYADGSGIGWQHRGCCGAVKNGEEKHALRKT